MNTQQEQHNEIEDEFNSINILIDDDNSEDEPNVVFDTVLIFEYIPKQLDDDEEIPIEADFSAETTDWDTQGLNETE